MIKITEQEAEQMYDDMLDECTDLNTLGIPAHNVIEQCDPTMYRCGFNDYIDSLSDSYEVEGY